MPAANIALVLLDVDGVLTDGSLWIGVDGEAVQRFHARDGMGIALLQQHGIPVGIISGRSSRAVLQRAKELKISDVYQGVADKLAVYEEILQRYHLRDECVAYMGDDLPDLPVLKRAGLSAAPRDAVPEVLRLVEFCAPCPGGCGAVRSLGEFILKAQHKWPY